MEHWKAVDGTNGAIEVSDLGRIRSNLRDGRILKACPDKKGYLRLRVTIERKKMSFKVHRLVAQAFIPNPENKPQVNHIDGNKTNNAVDNLEWVTNYENAHHAMDADLWGNVIAASKRANQAKRKPVIATNIMTGTTRRYSSIGEAEVELGTRHIVDVIKGKRSQAKGYRFEYAEGGDAGCPL